MLDRTKPGMTDDEAAKNAARKRALLAMEPAVCDLAIAAEIACSNVTDAVGAKGPITVTEQQAAHMMFLTGQVMTMARDIRTAYYAAVYGDGQDKNQVGR